MNCENKPFVEADISTWSEADYRRLLNEIEPLFLAAEGTPESDRADVLFNHIEAYEQSHFKIAEWREAKRHDAAETSLRRGRKRTEASDMVVA